MHDTGIIGSAVRRSVHGVVVSAMAVALAATGAVTAPLATAAPVEERATDHAIKVVTYNVGDKSATTLRDQLRRLMSMDPAAIGLQEVADREGLIRSIAGDDYKVLYEAVGQASKHNAILVRDDVRVRSHGAVKISGVAKVHPDTPGTGSGDTAPPKYINWAKIRVDGLRWTIGVVHLVPSAERWAKNRELHNRQVRRSAAWFASRPAEPLLMGDFNAVPRSSLLKRLRNVAKPWGKPSFGRRAIDIVWTKKDATGGVRALDGYGGDHRPVRVSVKVTR